MSAFVALHLLSSEILTLMFSYSDDEKECLSFSEDEQERRSFLAGEQERRSFFAGKLVVELVDISANKHVPDKTKVTTCIIQQDVRGALRHSHDYTCNVIVTKLTPLY